MMGLGFRFRVLDLRSFYGFGSGLRGFRDEECGRGFRDEGVGFRSFLGNVGL